MWTTRTKIGWGIMTALLVLLVLWSLRYFLFGAEAYFPRQKELYEVQTAGILIHIGGMMVAAALGPFQFLRALRDRHLKVHRAIGRLYLGGALVGGLGGLYMAQYSASGIVSDAGFGLLAVTLLLTTGMAFLKIKQGAVQEHREWMTRSFALILAAVTLRIYVPILEGVLGEHDGYAAVAWLCWIPNLLVAEWLIRGHLRNRRESNLPVAAVAPA